MFCDVEITYNGKKTNIKAMIDTGNSLRDPITHAPVIIVEKDKLEGVLPREILNDISKIIKGEDEFADKDFKVASRLRILPFSSLGKQNGILLGFKVDKVEAEFNEEEINREDVIIGIYDKKLSTRGEYNALMGLNCFNTRQDGHEERRKAYDEYFEIIKK